MTPQQILKAQADEMRRRERPLTRGMVLAMAAIYWEQQVRGHGWRRDRVVADPAPPLRPRTGEEP